MMPSQWPSSLCQAVSGAGASAIFEAAEPRHSKVEIDARISYMFFANSGWAARNGGAWGARVLPSHPRMRSMMKNGPPMMLASGSSQRMRGTGTVEFQKVE